MQYKNKLNGYFIKIQRNEVGCRYFIELDNDGFINIK